MAELTTDNRAYPLIDADQPQRTGVARLNAAFGAVDADVAALLLAVADMPGRAEVAQAINSAINGLVDDAPEALDTLREIAAKLADNDDAVAALVSALAGKADAAATAAALAEKAGTVPASTASDGLMAASDKTKLDGIALGATKTAIATVAQMRSAATTADIAAGVRALWDAHAIVDIADAATITLNLNTFIIGRITPGGNRTIANPTNATAGRGGLLFIRQDATGSRTVSWGSAWKFQAGAPTLSTAPNAVDIVPYCVENASVIRCGFSKENA